MKDMLIIGYGNPGRADDGLGVAFADEIEKLNLDDIEIESDYQLSVEHAQSITKHKLTLLADAHASCGEPFEVRKVKPSRAFSFSTHSVSPENLLKLANDMSNSDKDVYAIGIRGYEFNEFKESLSELATHNLKKTVDYFNMLLEEANPDIIKNKINEISSRG